MLVMKLAILIPAYNEHITLARVIKTLPKRFNGVKTQEIVIINDGSKDSTEEIAKRLPVTLLSHWLNRGLGGALGTGLEYAKKNNFDLVVTFDADGQHAPEDIEKVIKPILQKKADVVIGSRLKNPKGMPWYRIAGVWGLNIITLLLYLTWTTDSQSGLRAFSKKALEKMEIQSNRMEVSTEFFNEIQRNSLKKVEVPIKAIYTNYSLSKGQKNINVFKILSKLIYQRFFSK